MADQRPPSQSAMLVQILQDLAVIKEETKRITDHETRIRSLEKFVWSASILSAVLTAGIITIINKTIGG
jgi:hypothetical protein